MIRSGLVVAAILIALAGSAFADTLLVATPAPTDGVNRDRLWNPFIGTRPWIECIGYRPAARTACPAPVVSTAAAPCPPCPEGTAVVRPLGAPVVSTATIVEPGWYTCSDVNCAGIVRQ